MRLLTSVVAGLAIAACGDGTPRVKNCADSLAGVWRTAGGDGETRRYHIVESRAGIEIFAMFDTTVPPEGTKATSPVIYAPIVFDFDRARQRPSAVGLAGTRSQRVTREGRVCRLRTKAVIDYCEDDQIALRFQRPGPLSWSTCKAEPLDEWVALSLQRE
jgi:hypothetical protein